MRKAHAGLIIAFFASLSPALAQRVQNPQNSASVCAYNTSIPTLTSGWFGYIQCDAQGRLILSPSGSSIVTGNVSNATSGVAPTSTNVPVVGYNYVWNGTSWDQATGVVVGPTTLANSLSTVLNSQYPVNAVTTTPTAVTATATGTTAATAASLGATASVTNFVCGFDITADATALTTGTATLSGTISGSLNYLQTIVAVTNGTSQLTRTFNPCIPASAANTPITITSAPAGTGGNTIVNIWGYRL